MPLQPQRSVQNQNPGIGQLLQMLMRSREINNQNAIGAGQAIGRGLALGGQQVGQGLQQRNRLNEAGARRQQQGEQFHLDMFQRDRERNSSEEAQKGVLAQREAALKQGVEEAEKDRQLSLYRDEERARRTSQREGMDATRRRAELERREGVAAKQATARREFEAAESAKDRSLRERREEGIMARDTRAEERRSKALDFRIKASTKKQSTADAKLRAFNAAGDMKAKRESAVAVLRTYGAMRDDLKQMSSDPLFTYSEDGRRAISRLQAKIDNWQTSVGDAQGVLQTGMEATPGTDAAAEGPSVAARREAAETGGITRPVSLKKMRPHKFISGDGKRVFKVNSVMDSNIVQTILDEVASEVAGGKDVNAALEEAVGWVAGRGAAVSPELQGYTPEQIRRLLTGRDGFLTESSVRRWMKFRGK